MNKKDIKKENNAKINATVSAKRVCLVNYLRGYSSDLTDLYPVHVFIKGGTSSGPNLAAVTKDFPGMNHIEITYTRDGLKTRARFCCYVRLIFDNPVTGSFKRYSLLVIESHLDESGRSCSLGTFEQELSISGHYDLTIYPGKKIPWFDLNVIKVVEEKEGPMIRSAVIFDTLKSFKDAGRLENFTD